jgi:hypothetical protein
MLPLIPMDAARKVLGPGSHTARQKIPQAVIKENQKCKSISYGING